MSSTSSSLSCSSSQSSSPPTSLHARSNSINPKEIQPITTVDEKECLQDVKVKPETPNKKRFEPGFLFQNRKRNGSISSIFSNLSFRQTDRKSSQQQQQQQQSSQRSKLAQTQQASPTPSISQLYPKHLEVTSDKLPALPPRNESPPPSVVQAIGLESNEGVDQGTETKAESEDDIGINAEPNPIADSYTEISQAHDDSHLALLRSLPDTVVIRGLPKYSPGDHTGHNVKRNEVYARIRLIALREHQQVLVKLLSDLLEMNNLIRQNETWDQRQGDCHSVRGKSGEGTIETSPHDECHHIQQRQRRDIAVHEYQKAIVDFWQTDQNMSYWLIRYIRNIRRVGRSFEFMFEAPSILEVPATIIDSESTQDTTNPESTQDATNPESTQIAINPETTLATSDVELIQTATNPESTMATNESTHVTFKETDASVSTKDSESTYATASPEPIPNTSEESDASESTQGLSNLDLERIGILMPKLLKFTADGRKRDTFISEKLLDDEKKTTKLPTRTSSLIILKNRLFDSNRDSARKLNLHLKPLPEIPADAQDTDSSADPEVIASEPVITPAETVGALVEPVSAPERLAAAAPAETVSDPEKPAATSAEPLKLPLHVAPTKSLPATPAPSPPEPEVTRPTTPLVVARPTPVETRPSTPVPASLLSILPSPPMLPPPPLPATRHSTDPASLTQNQSLQPCQQPQDEDQKQPQDEDQKKPQTDGTSRMSSMPETSGISDNSKTRRRFEDFDDFEALIFIGLHMQSLRKSREFLKQFNRESTRSRAVIERFKAAKKEYELQVLKRTCCCEPKEQREDQDPQRSSCAFVDAF
ncbi:hypothetical protein BGX21_011235 [Mortierella sp. AD011]|nr:hypothetical protein BGX21_011235 [Mortierella sp. AD011]